MQTLLSLVTIQPHQLEDLLLYIPFLFGQLIYIMKRAGFSVRAGRSPSRWKYITLNWDIILFRTVLEFLLVFMPARHYSPSQILSLFHIDIGNVSWLSFFNNPMSSPASLLAAGIAADGIFDWIVDWASRSPKVPQAIKNWLTENVPPLPLLKD